VPYSSGIDIFIENGNLISKRHRYFGQFRLFESEKYLM
jgi:hypothetical protein